MTTDRPSPSTHTPRITVRALLLGDRIDATGLERPDTISTNPLAFRIGARGFAAIFRFGVVVLADMSPIEEEEFLRGIDIRISGRRDRREDEIAHLEVSESYDDQMAPGGQLQIRDSSPQRLLVVADALAKSVSLGRDEREVNSVFDIVEPFATNLASTGRPPWRRRVMLKLIGQALLAQHRVSGRIAIEEKPDVLWDRSDLGRLHERLQDEYELKERAGTLKRKLDVIIETTHAMTDMIDTDRTTRLEMTVVVLIVFEIFLTLWQMGPSWPKL